MAAAGSGVNRSGTRSFARTKNTLSRCFSLGSRNTFTPMATSVPMNTSKILRLACRSGFWMSGNEITTHRNTMAARLAVSGFRMTTAV